MLSEEQQKSLIVDYLIANKDRFTKEFQSFRNTKNSLLQNTNAVFHPDIQNEYNRLVKQEISKDIVQNLQIDQVNVYTLLEEININQYIGD